MVRRALLYVSAMGLLGTAVAAGCGSDNNNKNPETSGGEEVPISELHTAVASEFCARIFRCCDAAEIASVFSSLDPPPTTQAECEAAEAPFVLELLEGQKAAIEAGRLIYHPDRAAACYEKLGAVTCMEFRGELDQAPPIEACKTMFEGKVALGGPCAANAECADAETFCSGGGTGAADPTGTCVKKPVEGEACIKFTCAEGFVCETDTCHKLRAVGEPCDGLHQCASNFCDESKVCAPKRADGEPCDSDATACISGDCSAGKCVPFVSGMCDGP